MAKKSFSTNMKAGGGVNLSKKAKVKADVQIADVQIADVQIAGEEIVGMDTPVEDKNEKIPKIYNGQYEEE